MSTNEVGRPWYRNFWPWFIVGLLSWAVVGSVTTAVIAVSGSDSLVRDDWYKDGMAINRRLEQEELARSLGISATGRIDFVTGEISLSLVGDEAPTLLLELSHPTRSDRDVALTLERDASGIYRGALEEPLRGQRFYARLESRAPERAWRITGPLELADRRDFQLEPGA